LPASNGDALDPIGNKHALGPFTGLPLVAPTEQPAPVKTLKLASGQAIALGSVVTKRPNNAPKRTSKAQMKAVFIVIAVITSLGTLQAQDFLFPFFVHHHHHDYEQDYEPDSGYHHYHQGHWHDHGDGLYHYHRGHWHHHYDEDEGD
jgi:hypothetical protein